MFAKLKLRLKFALILGITCLGGIILSGAILSKTYYQNSQKEVDNKTLVLLSTINAVKDYTNTNIEPLLENKLKTSPTFIPETLPFFAAREIFESFRQQEKYQNFLYKEAALNPTNLRDKADSFESNLIERFRQDLNLKQLEGFRTIRGEELLYISRPLAVTQQSCLQCHSTPEAAPKSQLNSYGSENGFDWKLNSIIAAQTIYVPVREVFNIYRQQFFLAMVNCIIIFALIALLIDWLLKKNVIQPITPMAKLAREISKDEIHSDPTVELNLRKLNKVARRSDELGQLARVFQLMTEVVRSREQTLKQQVQQLRHEKNSVNKFTNLMTKKGKVVRWQHLLETAKRSRNFTQMPPGGEGGVGEQDNREE
jgi:methyl-accepting chemotaxis protein